MTTDKTTEMAWILAVAIVCNKHLWGMTPKSSHMSMAAAPLAENRMTLAVH